MVKYLKLLPLLAFVMLASCKLEPRQTYYTNVAITIDQRSVPRAVLSGESFNIYAHATLNNGCWSNIRFFFDTIDLQNFQLYALADYKDEGFCPEALVTEDTVINLTAAEVPGDYIIRIWMNAYEYELDTVTVAEVIKQ